MLSDQLLIDIVQFIQDKITSAEVVFDDGRVEDVQIMRKFVKGNLLRVHVSTANGVGIITDIRLKDADGKILINKPRGRIKTTGYALVSSFYIKITEEEIENPLSIFEVKEGLNG